MSDPVDWKDDPEDWQDEPEGGAMGGAEGPSKPLLRPKPQPPVDAAQEAHKRQQLAAEMSGGQSLAAMPEAQREQYQHRGSMGAAAELVSAARATPLIGAHIDEAAGALKAGAVSGPEYEKQLALARQTVDASVNHAPGAQLAGAAVGLIQPSSAIARVLLGTAAGASEGIGAAPTMKEAPRMGLIGAGAGFGSALLGEALRGGGDYLKDKQAGIAEKTRGVTDATIDKKFASLVGSEGGNTSAGSGIVKQLRDALDNPNTDPDLVRQIEEFLASPEGRDLHNQVVRSNLGRAPGQLAKIRASRDARVDFLDQMTPEARAAAAQARLDDPSALIRRMKELGPKIALPAIGAALGGPAGASAGALTSAALGRSGTTLRNGIMDPYVASRLLGAGSTVLSGAGRIAGAASPEVARGALAPYLDLLHDDDKR